MMFRCCFLVAVTCLFAARSARAAYADECQTLSGERGQCLPFSSCRDIEQRLLAAQNTGEQVTPELANFLQKASCGEFDKVRHFCCPMHQIQHNSKVMEVFTSSNFSCGSILNQRVANGHEVKLSSRPWMALLNYKTFDQSRFLCGGTLISNRYILTAAHCVYGLENSLYEIRLGEHRISTEKDCRRLGRREKCAPPVLDVGIEKMILHEKYDTRRITNDIALLRLNKTVEFQKHIKPICLPINDELKGQSETMSNYFVTGWGTTEKGSASDVLLQASVPIQSRSTCSQAYRREVLHTQLCVGGGDLQDSCKGDSGGPLQAPALYLDEYKLRMVVFGIVSQGVKSCGQISLPGLYTNVADYVQWITDTMARHGLQ
ncbi:serine protease grass [Drosophila grimshawi]|uniref:CLIP domain-containing serine protease n=1 Tax=Drosophila grimshawi TaxID=7222 RepID=B4JRF7_DROGR|nr:serine protease grass [Drosophila grimshawi]EDV91600.1 GH17524 [Drosophila grimshawi]EDV94347.1 GH20624 [Drosophila grimshawi]